MLSQKDQKKIKSKLSIIYKSSLSEKDLNYLKGEIIKKVRIKLIIIIKNQFFIKRLYLTIHQIARTPSFQPIFFPSS